MIQATASRLGIIAGGGTAPQRVIEACLHQKRDFFVICLEGQADKTLAHDAPHAWVALGAGNKLRDILAAEKITEIVMIGAVRRPSLWELKPDLLALKIVTKIGINMLGDDGLLRALGQAIEEEADVRMIGVQDILGGILIRKGPLGQNHPDAEALKDISRGTVVAQALGQVDVGQSVIVQQGMVLGVEAIEGTDALIARCKSLQRDGLGGVLIKLAKPYQDDRYDLPSIGPATISSLIKAGLRGIAIEAGRSLLIDGDQVKKLADEAGLFVVGITPNSTL
jgi:DUF1009 family protein